MAFKVLAPNVGESITEVTIINWAKEDGDLVKNGEMLLEIETDKASVEVVAEADGMLKIIRQAGETVPIGEVVAQIEEATASTSLKSANANPSSPPPSGTPSATTSSASVATQAPAVEKLVRENKLDPDKIKGTGKDGRLIKGDVLQYLEGKSTKAVVATTVSAAMTSSGKELPLKKGEHRESMSRLRIKIAQRLTEAQHTAAILTTFNEVDMTAVLAFRAKYKEAFQKKYAVKLGFMGLFTRASVLALQEFKEVNAYIEGNDILYHDYCNVGIAVGTEKGLVVPVVKDAHLKTLPQIEETITELALKGRDGKLTIDDMSGGTFTISNGGVYGSLMSTPILNPPQSAILGMHKTQERAVVVEGKVVARPMMYLALSYDHRIIDGKGAVSFLIKIKDYLEDPSTMQLDFVNEL